MIIDLSSNNGVIDFAKVKASGVTHVILRATMGVGTTDKMLVHNAHAAAKEGLLISYYHFSYPDAKMGGTVVSDAQAEANYFLQVIEELPAYTKLIIDCEPKDAQGNDSPLKPTEYALWLRSWIDIIEGQNNTKPVIYTYADYLNRHLPKGHTFGVYDLWIANYSTKITTPPLPNGWSKYLWWQYSQSGKVPGVSTNVDLSRESN